LVSAVDAAHAAVFSAVERNATTVTAAAEALRQMLEGGEHALQHCRDVMREEEADGITREVLIGIRTTFIRPFDRGDIKDLITSMDDAIDEMQKTAAATTSAEASSADSAGHCSRPSPRRGWPITTCLPVGNGGKRSVVGGGTDSGMPPVNALRRTWKPRGLLAIDSEQAYILKTQVGVLYRTPT
jgi:Protein of unknown function DUF47